MKRGDNTMKNLVIENKRNQIVLKLNKEGFNDDFLVSLVKKLKVEELTLKADFDNDILDIAEQINNDWWQKNGDNFLKDVKK